MKKVHACCEGQAEKQSADIILKQYMRSEGLEMMPAAICR